MAYDPYNPLDQIRMRYLRKYGIDIAPRDEGGPTTNYTPHQEASKLDAIKHLGMSGLQVLGNILDTPGAFVRDSIDLLTGGDSNPFANIFNPDERTTGWDLLDKAGFGENEAGFHPISNPMDALRDVGALVLEEGLNPLNYLSFGSAGALSQAGKAVKAADALGSVRGLTRAQKLAQTADELLQAAPDPTYARQAFDRYATTQGLNPLDLLDQPVRGSAQVHLPFGLRKAFGDPTATFTIPESVARMTGLEQAQDLLNVTLPNTRVGSWVGRHWAGAMDPEVMGHTEPEWQEVARRTFAGENAIHAEARANAVRHAQLLRDAGMLDDTSSGILRSHAENIPIGDLPPELADMVSGDQAMLANLLAEKQRLGAGGRALDDPAGIGYFPRSATGFPSSKQQQGPFSVFDEHNLGREDAYKGHAGGTAQVNAIISDPDVMNAPDVATAAQVILGKYGHLTQWAEPDRMARELAGSVRALSPEQRAAGLFTNHYIDDLIGAQISGQRAANAAREITAGLSRILDNAPRPGMPTVTLSQAIKDAGLVKGQLTTPGTLTEGVMSNIAQLRGMDPLDPNTWDILNHAPIEARHADALKQHWSRFTAPPAESAWMKLPDSYMNLFKSGVLTYWPARHVRDYMSGQARNLLTGNWSNQARVMNNQLMAGQIVDDALQIPIVRDTLAQRGIAATPQAATNVLQEIMHSMQTSGSHQATDLAGTQASSDTLNSIIGMNPWSWSRVGGHLTKPSDASLGGWNPFDLKGVIDTATGELRDKTGFRPANAGNDIGWMTDASNRGVPAIHNLLQGVDPAQVKKIVDDLQVSYDPRNYTAFERQVLKRLFPFYSYSSRMLPSTLNELWQNPGGGTAQVIHAINQGRDDNEPLPDYLRETAAIPLGNAANGDPRYLTGFGFMFEDPLSLLGTGTGLELLSRMNPLLKGPAEYFTNDSFFQRDQDGGGRALDDMDPLLGRTLANLGNITGLRPNTDPVELPLALESFLANSPLSRALTTARTVTDPRKHDASGLGAMALNLGSGLRTVDLPQNVRDQLVRSAVQKQMEELGARNFERWYFPKDMLAEMDPNLRSQAIEQQQIINILAHRARERAAQQSALGL